MQVFWQGLALPAFYAANLVRSQTSHTTSAWYFEMTVNAAVDISKIGVGIDDNTESLTLEAGRAGSIAWLGNGSINYNGVTNAYTGPSFAVGDVLRVNPDLSAKTFSVAVNGGSFSTAFSISAIVTGAPMFALAQLANQADQVTFNFTGVSPAFAFTAPATAWG